MGERRLLPRTRQDQPVAITLLNPPEESPIPATCVNASLSGACFRTQREIPPGSLIRVEADDALWLGEVVHCSRESAPVFVEAYLIGTSFEHSLIGLSQLQRTLQRLDWKPQPVDRT